MQEMTAHSWKRRGCSIVWSPELLRDLITAIEATPLDVVVEWQRSGFPEDPPAGANTVLVGGLQTVLNVMPDAETSYAWLRGNILPLCRSWSNHWPGVGLVFGMDGPANASSSMKRMIWFTSDASRNGRPRFVSLGPFGMEQPPAQVSSN